MLFRDSAICSLTGTSSLCEYEGEQSNSEEGMNMEALGVIALILAALAMLFMGQPGFAAATLLPVFGLLVLASN